MVWQAQCHKPSPMTHQNWLGLKLIPASCLWHWVYPRYYARIDCPSFSHHFSGKSTTQKQIEFSKIQIKIVMSWTFSASFWRNSSIDFYIFWRFFHDQHRSCLGFGKADLDDQMLLQTWRFFMGKSMGYHGGIMEVNGNIVPFFYLETCKHGEKIMIKWGHTHIYIYIYW